MVSAAGRALYAESRLERPRKRLRRYIDLTGSQISLLTRVFSNAPPPDLIGTSPRHEAYAEITLDLINALPTALLTSPPNKHLFGLFTSDNNQCLVPDPRRSDGRPFKRLCHLHSRLQCPLVHSILRFVLDEITFYMPKIQELPFDPTERSLFDQLVDVASLYMRPHNFEACWGRCPPVQWEHQRNKCAGCILARIGSDANVLIALSAVHRARVREETHGTQLRALWYEEWMRALNAQDGDYLIEKSRALGHSMKRVVRKARKQAEKIYEIDPDTPWAKKKPAVALHSSSSDSNPHQQDNSVQSEHHTDVSRPVHRSSRFSNEETLAKLDGTLNSRHVEKRNLHSRGGSVDNDRFSSTAEFGSVVNSDSQYVEMPTDMEKLYTGHISAKTPARLDTASRPCTPSTPGSISEPTPRVSQSLENGPISRRSATPGRQTIFLDNTLSGSFKAKSRDSNTLPDSAGIRPSINVTPFVSDVPELSESSTRSSSQVSSWADSVSDTPLNDAPGYSYILDDFMDEDDCDELPKVFDPPGPPPEKALPATPNERKPSPTQDLRPQPSINTAASESVYSFNEGPYGEKYTISLPPPPEPLQFRNMSRGVSPATGDTRRGSALSTPSSPVSLVAGTSNDQEAASLSASPSNAHTRLQAPNRVSTARVSQNVLAGLRRSSAFPVMRSGMTIGGTEFRNMLRAQDSDESFVDSHQSAWMREFEWEQPHPATSRVFC
ncbi:MAG: hypothetical protein M1821_009944 [Bathelium mastoideum]|nr:MAG: hypothetical protein M1821_009944 [Bathelium mastoideum]